MGKTLSEKLHLPNWERIAMMVAQGESPHAEADRRATVEAVLNRLEEESGRARATGDTTAALVIWLVAGHLRRELLDPLELLASPSPGEGRPEASDGE